MEETYFATNAHFRQNTKLWIQSIWKWLYEKVFPKYVGEFYMRTPMLECDFNKLAKPLRFFCKFTAYFQNTFLHEHF